MIYNFYLNYLIYFILKGFNIIYYLIKLNYKEYNNNNKILNKN